MVRKNTKLTIIECGLRILEEHGDHSLTMRKVATSAGISLGNLQYHFKNREALLKGMVDHYLTHCSAFIKMHLGNLPRREKIKKIHISRFLLNIISDEELIASCKTFREIWAISSRSESIKDYLEEYYYSTARLLENIFENIVENKRQLNQINSLLIPFLEGYTLTSDILPLSNKQIADMLAAAIWNILKLD
ncbi:TetR/AcrR family transcriptional regulator [Marinibactrum halimedae]|uniref:HTH tetR-type domain-containing protein n=1 Tax=Marinibactrum halimedae TaxID=1444977 RepID=A0AA37TFA0_9GAMM|nr:TetR/AcrR family transcriptional regulator [Marinibactrum halimedae]MCD9457625.1 TetR/AcrR family transcriptional regulator [Marinibactrum halimedae]GLS28047.1 hypothetical protein GCM10007877_37660 [Marinibactrum halimedae]